MALESICNFVGLASAAFSGAVLTTGIMSPVVIYGSGVSFKDAYKIAWEIGKIELKDFRNVHTGKMPGEEFRQKYSSLNGYLDKIWGK